MNMSKLKDFEKIIKPELKWKSIDLIPDFPFENLEQLRYAERERIISFGIDFSAANQFASSLYGAVYTYFFLFVSATWIWTGFASIVISFILGNYWLLLGIPLAFIAFFVSNPFNPAKGFFSLINIICIGLIIYAVFYGHTTLMWFGLFFSIPFIMNRFIYKLNRDKLKSIATQSETIFLYLFEIGALGIRINRTNETIWSSDLLQNKKKNRVRS